MNYKDKNFELNCTYKVISVFEQVVNLKKGNKIYAIMNQKIKPAPYSLILENELFLSIKNNISNTLFIPYFSVEEFDCTLFPQNNLLTAKNISTFLEEIIRPQDMFEVVFQQKRKTAKLKEMLGLGRGLTPSGDDYIVGYMAAYYAENKGVFKPFEEIAILAKYCTNEISANYIENASRRLFKQEILDLMREIENREYINNMMSFGSSSGIDLLYGIFDYINNRDLFHKI
ncbi:DUF2877 domain-containing protein [Avibacterium paragallinarum]|uniref:DUF2877 domain-containing protein n=1 Tax=Avibacterium paragallinarum TaxID=728 RepID=UPI001028AF5F|nr:DUF2877 domain-containing protein [Avibacterium paragallinarum]RZN58513.1 DUF2877 domain-containing protein [Avibacterium paragallinarum]TID28087.1 hypothetical protein JO83_03850 [Avibacterium paragallinarum]UXN34948.1 DUF2877 domain-containing protein [Avibacterium paragallinarum]